MQGDDLRDIVEADTESFYIVNIAGGHTVEFLEDVFLVFFRDADAVVGHLQDGVAVFGACGDGDTRLLLGVFDGVVDEVVHHVGYVQFVGEKQSVDRIEVGGECAATILDGELEALSRLFHNAVEVDFLGLDGELFARHLGTLQECFYQYAHAAVFVADDVDKVAPGGEVTGDTLVLEHLAGEADGGYGGLYLVGHIVDEVGLHLVEFMLGQDGTDGKDEECRNQHNHADADNGVKVGVATEDDGGGGEGEHQIQIVVRGDATRVEGVFKGSGAQVVGVGVFAAIEQAVGIGQEYTYGGGDVHAIDD